MERLNHAAVAMNLDPLEFWHFDFDCHRRTKSNVDGAHEYSSCAYNIIKYLGFKVGMDETATLKSCRNNDIFNDYISILGGLIQMKYLVLFLLSLATSQATRFSRVTCDMSCKPQIFHANTRHNCMRYASELFSGGDLGVVFQHHQFLVGTVVEECHSAGFCMIVSWPARRQSWSGTDPGTLNGSHTGHVWKIMGHRPKIKDHAPKLRVTFLGSQGHGLEFGRTSDCSQEVEFVIWVIRLHCSTGLLPTILSTNSGLLKSLFLEKSNQQSVLFELKWGLQEEESAAKLRFLWDRYVTAHLTGLFVLCPSGCKIVSEDVPLAATWHRQGKSQASLMRM